MTGAILAPVPGNRRSLKRAQLGDPVRSASAVMLSFLLVVLKAAMGKTFSDVINRALAGLFGEPAPW